MKIFCQQCGNELKDGVVICPKCGFENKIVKGRSRKKFVTIAFILLIFMIMAVGLALYKYDKLKLPSNIKPLISRYLGVKEYVGKDLIKDSISPREEGAKNLQAQISDSRDGKVYRIVKMPDNRWWLAQNLNFQKGLTQNERSDYANGNKYESTSDGTPGIGSYWCNDGFYLDVPWEFERAIYGDEWYNARMRGFTKEQIATNFPGQKGSGSAINRINACNTLGALYTWETAMLPDGNGQWNESRYDESLKSHNICPLGWRLPTDTEWAAMLNAVETAVNGNQNHDSIIFNWAGEYAGTILKSTASNICQYCLDSTSNVEANWQISDKDRAGLDLYGFNVIPSGSKGSVPSNFGGKGKEAYFWSSTRDSSKNALMRQFDWYHSKVFRGFWDRMNGLSVRCIQDISN